MTIILKDFERLEHKAIEFGLQWETKEQIMAQIRQECVEVEEHFNSPEQKDALQDELGDLLHAVLSLSVFCGLDPERTLRQSMNKFEHRLNAMKKIAQEEGLSHLRGKSFDELMLYWQKAKKK